MASGVAWVEEALADSRAKFCAKSVISVCGESMRDDRGVGTRVGQSRSDPETESRRGLSLASIKLRLSREGLGA